MHTRPIDIVSSSERRVPLGPNITISEYHDNQEAGAYEENYDPVIPDENASALLWAVLSSYLPSDENSIQRAYVQKVEYDMALTRESSKNQPQQQFMAFALCLRDRLIERWKDTDLFFKKIDARVVNYLSLEFLLGRSLQNAVDNLNLRDNYSRALRNLGVQMEKLFEQETDAGLGNGGLGRLAACFLDSLATMNYPAVGYGLRYTYGMFYQQIKDGYQVEIPDFWLRWGHPWEIERFDIHYNVQFYGHVRETLNPTPRDENDVYCYSWEETENVMAIAYDVPIPGYNTFNTINLRLWSSKPAELQEFDFKLFNQGDYFKAVEKKQLSETITSLLYPNDNTSVGKALRLKQQYFFVCATLQDIIKKYKMSGKPITKLHKKVAIQLNDTHPSMSIAEMMRILFDVEKLTWAQAWKMTRKIFAYTNHTVLPEALEAWDVDLLAHTLPRHLQIIYKINHHFLLEVVAFYSNKPEANVDEMKRRLSIIQEGPTRKIRMAHLAIIGSHMVNGVAALHSFLLTTDLFPEFNEIYPNKFCNVTNGVTPRRWIHQANPALSNLITETLKTDTWLTDLSQLAGLREFAKDPDFQKKWRKVKQDNKKALVNYIKNDLGINIPSRGLFDVQIKRMHEYKRQFMNILSVVYRYLCLKKMTEDERIAALPQVIIFGGKAAPGYHIAKLIIKLINLVGAKINNDPDMESLLKVVFIPNYNVSLAEMLIPASDISQHISTAGMEASGTSNMKFAMNGGLILGTMDGANIEIREEIGEENMFIFGALTEEVEAKRKLVRSGQNKWSNSFKEVIDFINTGNFGDFPEWHELLNSIDGKNDYYLIADDWEDYLKAKERIEEAFLNKDKWTEMSILSVAGTGKFSSDRSVKDYAEKIWNLKPHPRPGPMVVDASFLSSHIPRGLSAARPLDSMGSPQSISMERLSEYNAKLVESFSPSPSNYRSTGLDGW